MNKKTLDQNPKKLQSVLDSAASTTADATISLKDGFSDRAKNVLSGHEKGREIFKIHQEQIKGFRNKLKEVGIGGNLPLRIMALAMEKFSKSILRVEAYNEKRIDDTLRIAALEIMGDEFANYEKLMNSEKVDDEININAIGQESIELLIDNILATQAQTGAKSFIRNGKLEIDQFVNKLIGYKYPKPIPAAEVKLALNNLSEIIKKHGGKIGAQSYLKPNDIAETVPGQALRKVYLSPPIVGAASFLDNLIELCNLHQVKYLAAKENFADLALDKFGNAISQDHNMICFYFRNDDEFNRFIPVVAEAEKRSKTELIHFPKNTKFQYGQALYGKINFGVDLPGGGDGTNFDFWMFKVISAGLEAKIAGGNRVEIRKAMEAKLQEFRPVKLDDYLSI